MKIEKTTFAGDVLLDGKSGMGDIKIENGLVKDDRRFDTAIYLSLFGGNKNDDAGREKETWWGNLIPGTKENEKIVSSFHAAVSGLPMTAGNIKRAAKAAEKDLEWLTSEKIADTVEVSLTDKGHNRAALSVTVAKDKENITETEYSFQWQGGADGVRE